MTNSLPHTLDKSLLKRKKRRERKSATLRVHITHFLLSQTGASLREWSKSASAARTMELLSAESQVIMQTLMVVTEI